MSQLRVDVEKILASECKTKYNDPIEYAFFFGEYSATLCAEHDLAFWNAGITVELADSYGGEGMGDQYWCVYKFSRGDETEYLKFDGWYQSYNGAEYTNCFWVKRKEVVVTKFVPA